MTGRRCFIVGVLLARVAATHAHPEHGETMADLDRILAANPNDATRLLWRAELHRLDGDLTSALADVSAAERVDPTSASVNLDRGRILLDARDARGAVVALEAFITSEPTAAEGHLLLARALAESGETTAADQRYAAAVALIQAPRPDEYVEWARLRLANGDTSGCITVLDTGIARIGLAPGLVLEAVDVETSAGLVESALARVEGLAQRFPRRGVWTVRRAQILERAGRRDASVAAWRAVLAEIESLPEARRSAPDAVGLAADARAALTRLGAGDASPTTGSQVQSVP